MIVCHEIYLLLGNLTSVEHVQIVWNNKTSKPISLPLTVRYIPFNGIRVSEDAARLNSTLHSRHHAHHRTSLGDLKIKVDQIQTSSPGGMTLIVSVGSSYYSRMKFRFVFVCMDVWMYGCMDVWMYGCMDVWMYGCMDVWMYGCMDE